MEHWFFSDPRDLAVLTVQQVVRGGQPVLLVSHDSDGFWQFLPQGIFDTGDAMVVSLYFIVSRDPSLMELADLPLGWEARRISADARWHREKRGDKWCQR
jgi:hypothetical protein